MKAGIGTDLSWHVSPGLHHCIPSFYTTLAEGLALLAEPSNVCESMGYMRDLCDSVWFRAGDSATDINWYTKRASLAALYGATEIFMLQDKSDDFSETWDFLDRRLEDLGMIGAVQKSSNELGTILSGLAVTAKNMAGFNNTLV